MAAFAGLCALMVYLFAVTPTGFVPEEDQGYVMAIANLPNGATIARTREIMDQVSDMALATDGVADVVEVSGYNIIDSVKQPYAGFAFVVLKPWGERTTPQTQLKAIIKSLR